MYVSPQVGIGALTDSEAVFSPELSSSSVSWVLLRTLAALVVL